MRGPVLFAGFLAVLIAFSCVCSDSSDAAGRNYGSGNVGALQIEFGMSDGGCVQYVSDGKTYWLPDAEISGVLSDGKVLAAWQDSHGNLHQVGESTIACGNESYSAVWVNASDYDRIVTLEYTGSPLQWSGTYESRAYAVSNSYTTNGHSETAFLYGTAQPAAVDQSFSGEVSTVTVTVTGPGVYEITAASSMTVSGHGVSDSNSWGMKALLTVIDPTVQRTYSVNCGNQVFSGPLGTTWQLPTAVTRTQDGWEDSGSSTPSVYPLGGAYAITEKRDADLQVHEVDLTSLIGDVIGVIVYNADGGISTGPIGEPTDASGNGTVGVREVTGLSKPGYEFVGWTLASNPGAIYLPGYVLEVDSRYIEMKAVWVAESDIPGKIDLVFTDGYSIYPSGQVFSGYSYAVPCTGFGDGLVGWSTEQHDTFAYGEMITVPFTAKGSALSEPGTYYPVLQEGEPFIETASVTLVMAGTGPRTYSVVKGTVMNEPWFSVSQTGYVLACWQDSNGTAWDFSQPVTESMTLYAKIVKVAELTVSEDTVTVGIAISSNGARIDWHDGNRETVYGSSCTHTFPENSSGTVTVSADSLDYGVLSVDLPYSVGAKGKVVVYADGVQITLDKGACVSDVDIASGRDGWYSDTTCTAKIDSEAVLADGMRLYSKPIAPEEAGEKQDLPLGLIVLSMSALLIFAGAARRFI